MQRLEFHVRTLSEAREEDKKRIADLERELSNCIQEIGGGILYDSDTHTYTRTRVFYISSFHLFCGNRTSVTFKKLLIQSFSLPIANSGQME